MELAALLLTAIIGITLFIYYFIHRRLNYWKVRDVPHIEPEFLYGNARGVGKTIFSGQFFKDMYLKMKNKGPLVGIYMYVEPMAMAMDLDLIKAILVKDFNKFPNRGGYHNEEDDPVSANLASIDDEKWRVLRHKLTPTFTSGKIKMMFPIICEVADKMIERIAIEGKQKGAIEVKDIHSRFTTDVIGKVAFGIECNSLEDNTTRFYQMGLKAFSNVNFWKRTLTTNYPDLARKLHITTSDSEVSGFYKDVVEQTIKYRSENNVQSNDFMSLLIKMMKENALTFNEVWAQSVVFFLAGYETSSTTLSYCIYEMAQSEEIRQKARESVRKVLEKHNGEFTYEAVNEMQYVEQCINGEPTNQ
jgi:cytochrome P450 family 6